MRRAHLARASAVVFLAALSGSVVACTSDDSSLGAATGDAGGPSLDAAAASDAPVTVPADAGEGGAANRPAACLDRPGDLPRPPSGGLPCELLPPGFGQ